MRRLLILLFAHMIFVCNAQGTYKQDMTIMGCLFDITVIADSQPQADEYIHMATSEMKRIESLISSWDPSSQTSQINRLAGVKPLSIDFELYQLIERSLKISELTDGAFDISYASMDRIWTFDGSMISMPDDNDIAESVSKVGYENIILNPNDTSVFLKHLGMKIGFGAIGKGYAADKAKTLLQSHGVMGGIINASGDMNTWGNQINGDNWNVAITNPMNKAESYGILPLKKGAVVTSGNYEKYVTINGKRYAHIIDPRSGMPATGILSVTVFAPSAELADAMATSIFVMGIEVGLDRINQLLHLDCIIVDENGHLHYSNNIQIDNQ